MGLFQGLMPIIGYVATNKVYDFLVPYSRLIVCLIFFILGIHFIFEALQPDCEHSQCIDWRCLAGFGIATSIDALISGVTLCLTSTNLVIACLIIGGVSFVMSLVGFWIGNYVKNIPSKYLEIAGGLVLILLALKSLV